MITPKKCVCNRCYDDQLIFIKRKLLVTSVYHRSIFWINITKLNQLKSPVPLTPPRRQSLEKRNLSPIENVRSEVRTPAKRSSTAKIVSHSAKIEGRTAQISWDQIDERMRSKNVFILTRRNTVLEFVFCQEAALKET